MPQSHTSHSSHGAPIVSAERPVAYFSMEIGLRDDLPTFSGGLGVLAGDTIRATADLGIPMVAVTMCYAQGYFRQHIDSTGQQSETPVDWRPENILRRLPQRVQISVEGRTVHVGAFEYIVEGVSGGRVPVLFLDTHLPENSTYDQSLSNTLYGGDDRYRLCQEVVLGLGGVAMLAATGRRPARYHMNEGHAALLTLAVLQEQLGGDEGSIDRVKNEHVIALRRQAVFTTHTPVPAGHDRFAKSLALEVLGPKWMSALERLALLDHEGRLNMTTLALACSGTINGVAKRHAEVSRDMFAHERALGGRPILAITNGVHASSWTAKPVQALFDAEVPGWRQDSSQLRYLLDVPLEKIRRARQEAKVILIAEIKRRSGHVFDPQVFTIGFARRAATYKRADLLFGDLPRLAAIAKAHGGLQIVYGGKAHPRDMGGKALIKQVHEAAAKIHKLAGDLVRVVYLENYDLQLGLLLTSGTDLWLNTPLKPLEASGTSGMKAAINGVPSLSTLDGWWVEGCVEGVTGWEIQDDQIADPHGPVTPTSPVAVASIHDKLEKEILPAFRRGDAYLAICRNAMALNGSFFNTHRMMEQYRLFAYA